MACHAPFMADDHFLVETLQFLWDAPMRPSCQINDNMDLPAPVVHDTFVPGVSRISVTVLAERSDLSANLLYIIYFFQIGNYLA